MSASRVKQLRVYEPIGISNDTREIPGSDQRYRTVRSIIDRSLLILESPQGHQALRDLGTRIVTYMRQKGRECRYPSDDHGLENMARHVDYFLKRVKSGFPEVYLVRLEEEALSVRYGWGTATSVLEDFIPQEAGHLEMNTMIIKDMIRTRNVKEYDTFVFQMVISTAHELGHIFSGYITGRMREATPNNVKVPGSDAEAGFFLEARALGGIVVFYSNPDDPDNVHQAGIAYIFPDAGRATFGRKVPIKYIEEFVAGGGDFRLPIERSLQEEPKTRSQLDRISKKMIDLRKKLGAEQDSR